MKTLNSLFILLTIITLTSCGENNGTSESSFEKTVVDFHKDTLGCDCSDLAYLRDGFAEPIEGEQHIMYLNNKKYTDTCFIKQFDDKSNKEYREYKNGLLDGKYFKWHENQKLASSLTFIKGLEHGEYREFDQNGKLVTSINFVKGMPSGVNYYKKLNDDGTFQGWKVSANIFNKLKFDDLKYEYQYNNYTESDSKHKLDINYAFELNPEEFSSLNRKLKIKDKYTLRILGRDIESVSEKNMKAFIDTINNILYRSNSTILIGDIYFGDPEVSFHRLDNTSAVDYYAIDHVRMVSPKHLEFFKLLTNSKWIKLDPNLIEYIETAKKGETKNTNITSNSDDSEDWDFADENEY